MKDANLPSIETWFWPHGFVTEDDFVSFVDGNSHALFEQAYRCHHHAGRGALLITKASDFLTTTYQPWTIRDAAKFMPTTSGVTAVEMLNEYDPSQEMLVAVLYGASDAWLSRVRVVLPSHN